MEIPSILAIFSVFIRFCSLKLLSNMGKVPNAILHKKTRRSGATLSIILFNVVFKLFLALFDSLFTFCFPLSLGFVKLFLGNRVFL